jgi:hypothetical protein
MNVRFVRLSFGMIVSGIGLVFFGLRMWFN